MSGKVLLSRVKDRSLEAYKAWIMEMLKHITGKEGDDGSMTEEQWREGWQRFWEKVDEAAKDAEDSQPSSDTEENTAL